MPRPTKNPGVIRFTAELQADSDGSAGFVIFPYDLKELYGIGNLVPVTVTFDGIPYQGSIAKMGPQPMLLIRKDVRAQLNKRAGEMVEVTVTAEMEPRQLELPPELVEVLKQNSTAQASFDTLAYTHRREYAQWVGSAKQAETRQRRADKALEMILERLKK